MCEAFEADQFVCFLFRFKEKAQVEATQFVDRLIQSVRDRGGKLQTRSDNAKLWEVVDGGVHLEEPNHLNPAIFDFTSIALAGFSTLEEVQMWWNSDQVFNILKFRDPIEKMGIYVIEGLQKSTDLLERNRFHFGDRILFFEFMKTLSFRPLQQYVDDYKRAAETAKQTVGKDCSLLFAESVSTIFFNEFPLDMVCASSWRMKPDAHQWYDATLYQEHLMPLRKEYSRCLSLLVPIFPEDRVDDFERAKKVLSATSKLNSVVRLSQKGG
mmetsp:Transcript_25734/g.58564  ORF Transcript_25734/g.58564 Transcript_25734/m.58564 type:complete len:269 (-) Transcript_25734:70-876(-)